MSILDDLRNKGLIEKVEPDQAAATGWLDDAGRHLDAATMVADLDPSGAYVLAYDAARKSVAAALLMSGHRVLSRPGSQQALVQYAESMAAQSEEPALTPVRSAQAQPQPDPSTDHGPSVRPRWRRPSRQLKRFSRPARASSELATESEHFLELRVHRRARGPLPYWRDGSSTATA